jgi:hypothetical protein
MCTTPHIFGLFPARHMSGYPANVAESREHHGPADEATRCARAGEVKLLAGCRLRLGGGRFAVQSRSAGALRGLLCESCAIT